MISEFAKNLTYVTDLLVVANNYTDGFLGVFILIIISFGSLFITSNFNTKESLIASSFLTMIFSIFLMYLNMLNEYFVFISLAYLIVVVIMVSIAGSRGT